MISIRQFLVRTTISSLVIIIFIALLNGYTTSSKRVEAWLDSRLVTEAEFIQVLAQELHNSAVAKPSINLDAVYEIELSNGVYFQVFDVQKRLILKSKNTSEQPLTGFNKGFSTSNSEHGRLRCLVELDESNNLWIMIGEPDEIRFSIIDDITLSAALPIIVVIPLIGFLIWVIISVGMKPLRQLSEKINAKEMNDLSPLNISEMPTELRPLTVSTNALLVKLSAAFAREKRISSDVTHELRTPIAAARVHLDNLIRELPNGPVSMHELSESIDRIEHLAEQILFFNKIAPDVYQSNFRKVDLHELLQSSIARNYSSIEQKNQKIELLAHNLQGETGQHPFLILGDNTGLERLIDNLLENAIKYTPEAGHLSVAIDTIEGGTVEVLIEDSGSGISEADREKVFDRFYRVVSESSLNEPLGSGLGLSIVRRLAVLHNASVELHESLTLGGLAVKLIFKKQ